ncbi:FHA domain-containing protein, partial [Streptomyces sp. NPDC049744]|uniref:FHA domain-containing protein n=1 Tax=Streptomyces sp. NPDC049744 TaxID=3154359 RepID=UPI003429CCB1
MGHGVPELVLESNGRTWTLDPSRSYALGRDPQGELVFDDARVSWRHATISFNGRSWVVEDHGSTNGTFVHGQRVQQTELGAGTVLNLGNATDGPRVSLTGAQAPAGTPQAQPQQQPYAAQGANAGWAQQAPPAQEPFQQQAPPQQVPP